MNNLPDLAPYGYQVIQELGRNREGGRITWKGINLSNQQTVTIKQFCFASAGSTWSGYSAYQQESKILQQLKHSGIPRYLDTLETDDGFCLIQEYKKATNLSDFRSLTLTEIKQVALEILEILIYLQQQNPPILHRDLKPENILIDEDLQVYLIDFGFASLGSKEISSQSICKGTPGFMPPEQIIKPTTASDVYSLGVTIICLLTQKNSREILELIAPEHPYILNFQPFLPPLEPAVVDWLGKMVEPQVGKRFANAAQAKAALEPLNFNLDATAIEDTASIVPQISARDAEKTPAESIEVLDTKPVVKLKTDSFLTPPITFALSATAIMTLSTTFVLALNLANNKIEKTVMNIAIAIIAAVVITIGELAAATLATDKQTARPAFILAVTIPLLLLIITSLLLGKGEAIAICAAIALAEGISLTYVFWQQLTPQTWGKKVAVFSWFSAIALGITLGLKLIA